MTIFKVGDWVEITSRPDKKWQFWADIQDGFCGEIGEILEIQTDPNDDGEFLYKVSVYFPDGIENLGENEYWCHFKDRHIILSSKTKANVRSHMRKAGKELQEWESFKKKAVDDALRKVFTPPPKKSNSKPKPVDVFDVPDSDWDDVKTDPMLSAQAKQKSNGGSSQPLDALDEWDDLRDYFNSVFAGDCDAD